MSLYEFGEPMSTDYENICGNCRAGLGEKDKYCRVCGTKRGDGAFKPYKVEMNLVYGPPSFFESSPEEVVHICTACNKTWKKNRIKPQDKYCPVCGNLCETYDYNDE